MAWVYHPKCDSRFWAAGNRSGHCAQCCDTYYGITAFDKHQRLVDGKVVCARTGPLWWQDDKGSWHHGERLTEEKKRELWGD